MISIYIFDELMTIHIDDVDDVMMEYTDGSDDGITINIARQHLCHLDNFN